MIDKERIDKFFKEQMPIYSAFESKLKELIAGLINESNISIHKIESRTKSKDSLLGKIEIKDKYESFDEITDICGIRIITYLDRDVDEIKKLLSDHFNPDKKNSLDKRDKKPNEFGYKSFHLVIDLGKSRLKLPEYQKFSNCKAEIQIRSILQHAWAEIEHDLGYKSKDAVPYSFIRGFNALSALLEIADNEFQRLKEEKAKYQAEVISTIQQPKNKSARFIAINPLSLEVFADSNHIFEEIRSFLVKDFNVRIISNKAIKTTILKLDYLKIKDISELENKINESKVQVFKFIKLLFERRNLTPNKLIRWDAPLTYFMHYWAAAKGREYLDKYIHYGQDKILGAKVIEAVNFIKLYKDSQIV